MAEQSVPELADPNSAAKDMDLDSSELAAAANGEPNSKRPRDNAEENADGEDASKKPKVEGEKSVEEERLEKEDPGRVSLGPKSFGSSVEMFDYFYKFLHHWPTNLNINKYEQLVLADLLKKGHAEPEKKIGGGIRSFQVRFHPMFKSRCFFLVRDDESYDDFSFRKCVDRILPLPEDMKAKLNANKALGGGNKGRGGRGGGRGGGWRGAKSRN